MIRPITADDAPTVAEVAVASELFAPVEAGIVSPMMSDFFGGNRVG